MHLDFTPSQIAEKLQNFPIPLAFGDNFHFVYSHSYMPAEHTGDPILAYIGVCKFAELFDFTDAKRNTEWRREFGVKEPRSVTIYLNILYVCTSREEADNFATIAIATRKPPCNIYGKTRVGKNSAIICNEDGQEFDSMSEAARYYGCSTSLMINHINKPDQFRTVKGRTFKRV